MLTKILIQNFALIDKLEMNLPAGLLAITGETGAGKSIILGALRLILGERADLKAVGNTKNKCVVETEFLISEDDRIFFDTLEVDFDTQLIIRREILPNAKSRAFINDVPVTLEVLKEIASRYIDIHSQFESSKIFTQDYQFQLIDGISGNLPQIIDYQSVFSDYLKKNKKLETLLAVQHDANKQADYNAFILDELQKANLDECPFEEMQTQLETMENAERIREHLAVVFSRMEADEVGILEGLAETKNQISKATNLSKQFADADNRLDATLIELKDILTELRNLADAIPTDPQELAELNLKINHLQQLFQKHQILSVPELIEIRNNLQKKQSGLEDSETEIAELKLETEKLKTQLELSADKISKQRKKSAPDFSSQIREILKNLGLDKAKLEVLLSPTEQFNSFGKEKIEILFQANSGFPLKPIQTAISGGERSRLMLAVKKIMAENTELPTLILDEIDTGVSGKIASEMGVMMKDMAKNMQLIVITHLAQVAAKGDKNFKVLKEEKAEVTHSTIVALDETEKLHEIAQLLSGASITKAALEQAKELMK